MVVAVILLLQPKPTLTPQQLRPTVQTPELHKSALKVGSAPFRSQRGSSAPVKRSSAKRLMQQTGKRPVSGEVSRSTNTLETSKEWRPESARTEELGTSRGQLKQRLDELLTMAPQDLVRVPVEQAGPKPAIKPYTPNPIRRQLGMLDRIKGEAIARGNKNRPESRSASHHQYNSIEPINLFY